MDIKKYMREKGVSEVIGTLLMLAITVTLFSSVFYYVATMPPPQTQVYASFKAQYYYYQNGTFKIIIYNVGGESLNAKTTELLIFILNPTNRVTYLLSNPLIYEQINSYYFSPGMHFTYYSWWNGIKNIGPQSSITLYLIDKLNNQIVWYDVIQGYMKSLEIIGISYFPQPFPALVNFNGKILAYVIYNPSGQIPTVKITIPKMNIFYKNMSYLSPMTFYFQSTFSSISPGNYTVKINAILNNINISYYGNISVQMTSQSNMALRITSISLSSPDPIHGSTDLIILSINNPTPNLETFYLKLSDYYHVTNSWSNISTGEGNPIKEQIMPYTSSTFVIPWINVGGNNSAMGNHTLYANITDPIPAVPAYGNFINFTVMPRILMVDDEDNLTNTQYSVFNIYYQMMQYMDYNFTPAILPSYLTPISLNGYDLVIWITGYSSHGLGPQQKAILENYVSTMNGALLLIGSSLNDFNGMFGNGASISQTPIFNTTIKYYNLPKISSDTLYMPINYTGYLKYSSLNSYVILFSNNSPPQSGQGGNGIEYPLASISGYHEPSVVYGKYNYGRFIFVGYEFSRMNLYQDYFILNRMVLWLSNISSRSGLNDLALVDFSMSPSNPLFLQKVNLSFYVMNLAPGPFGNQNLILEYTIGGMQHFITVGNITQGNGYIKVVNTTWIANLSPGSYTISTYLNWYHNPPEVNYNNNMFNSITDVKINVIYSVLFVYLHTGNDNDTALANTLNNLKINFKFINYQENGNNFINFVKIFPYYNLVILDFNNSGNFGLSTQAQNVLSQAIYNYLNNPNASYYPYNLLILGENSGNAFQNYGNGTLYNALNIYRISTSNTHGQGQLFGLNYNNVNPGLNQFEINVTRGIGFVYYYSSTSTVIQLNNNARGLAILDGLQYPPLNQPIYAGRAITENISNVNVIFFPYDWSNILGLIQNHTSYYSPNVLSSNPLNYQTPSAKQYIRNLLMINFLNAFRYKFNYSIPEILSVDLSLNSNHPTLNNYYIISGIVRNLGTKPISVILQSYEETSLFSTQTIYLPGLSVIPFEVIWKPTYASSPNPEVLRFVLNTNNLVIPTSMLEAILFTPAYFFYDDFSNGFSQNWIHYADAFAYSGVSYWSNFFSGLTKKTSDYIPSHPYSIFGPVDNIFYSSYIGNYNRNSVGSWNLYPDGSSGGYSLGISWNVNSANGRWARPVYVLETYPINIKGSASAYIEFYASYQLAYAAEGVLLFISHDQGTWYWIPPVGGYHNNGPWENLRYLTGNYLYPVAGSTLTPMFVGVSGGGLQPKWVFFKFNLDYTFVDQHGNKQYINASQWQTLWVEFVFIGDNSYNGGNINVYGNDNFFFDDFKIVETGPLYPQNSVVNSGTSGDTWKIINGNQIGLSNNLYGYYVSITPDTIDNLVSVPIDLVNAISVNMNFLTTYSIWARFSYAQDPTDVPNGFRLYIGVSNGNEITWSQLDTRWAGEAGIVSLTLASYIPSVYYPGIGAFSSQLGPYIDLTSYAGQTIHIKFEVNGDYPSLFHGSFGTVESVSSDWVFITDVIVSGYSLYSPVYVNLIWT
ncbi:MAG: type IV pilin N-terminal domain-containing protein [Thermoplasmata archaeon]